MNTTRLHLIPVSLGDSPVQRWLPPEVQTIAGNIDVYIAENAKTARAFLKQIGTVRPIQEITIHTLTAKTSTEEIHSWLKAPGKQGDIGLVSEAGCPAVADPGALVAREAHRMGIQVIPWVGPSSILLGLMASGLDGQRFTFHGYAPVQGQERIKQLQQWESLSAKLNQTQLFIETPYRNIAMFEALLKTLKSSTRLCIARSLTTNQEWIQTHTITEWKKRPIPDIDKQATLFLFLA
ncbi:SAM-dependent methyltransferase [Pelistega sp. NLN82]|uniref:SAM-dependent methyltransferase n=1 Tax=Pelistega ratti TaxID=2652177 RepID=A0A6L9Y561_9BURK|nr:SAM-dependent methyltransferase [Pelistega ratti]NEN75612.1 SAM-dependent methyltransferase [Pelistega ratti]